MRTATRAATFVVALLTAFCADPEAGPAPASEGCLDRRNGQDHAIYYELHWDDEGVIDKGPDGAWTTLTDLGYRVQITEGFIVNYSAQLVECGEDEYTLCEEQTAWHETGWRSFGLGMPFARAGHGSGENDPSAVEKVYAQSLTASASLQYGAALAAPAVYCRTHYLAGPLTTNAEGGIEDETRRGLTLWATGYYTPPEGGSPVRFAIETTSAYGVFGDLRNAEGNIVILDSGQHAALVHVQRPRGRMFDGIDFKTESAEKAAKVALANLVRDSSVTIYIDAN